MIKIIALSMLLLTAPALAQGDSSSGSAPDNKGNTGWTGGAPDTGGATQNKPKKTPAEDAALAEGQPEMAEGLNLRQSHKFPAYRTVE
jgi:hypothetical protein